MRRLLTGWLLLCACFNPGGSDDSSTTAPATTGGSAPPLTTGTSDPSTGPIEPTGPDPSTTTTITTGDPSSPGETLDPATDPTTTTPETTDTTGPMSCPGECGPCQQCLDGICVAGDDGGPCPGDTEACAKKVHGPEQNACHAAAPGPGVCSSGACMFDCSQKGPVITSCTDVACVREGNNPCIPNAEAAGVSVATFCAVGEQTLKCSSLCNDVLDVQQNFLCDAMGKCNPTPGTMCFPYGCDPMSTTCADHCNDQTPCAEGATCELELCD